MTVFQVKLQKEVLVLSGDMTLETLVAEEPLFKQLLNQSEVKRVAQVDLSQVAQIDSLAWAWLLRLQSHLSEPLTLLNLPEKLKTLATLYDLNQTFLYQ